MNSMRPPTWWRDLADRITERTGFVVRERDVKKLNLAIDGEVASRTSSGTWKEYLRLLDTQSMRSSTWQSLLNAILIGETYMFRHSQQYDFLANTILENHKGPIKCWSAGCATGEEAFTMSIVFHEKGRTSAQIVGSDISVAALNSASRGKVTARKGCAGTEARAVAPQGVRRDVCKRQRAFSNHMGLGESGGSVRSCLPPRAVRRDHVPERADLLQRSGGGQGS